MPKTVMEYSLSFVKVNVMSQKLIDIMTDLEKYHDKLHEANTGLDFEYHKQPVKRIKSIIDDIDITNAYYIVRNSVDIVGYYYLSENGFYNDTININELYVVPQFRGGGIGRITLRHIKEEYKKKGFKFITVGYIAGNDKAAELYKSEGLNKKSYVTLIGAL